MWKEPKELKREFILFDGVTKVQFGFAQYGGGQTVGTNPLMCRIVGNALYPNDWFVVRSRRGLAQVFTDFTGRAHFLPDWLRADCYEHHYHVLKTVTKNTPT